MIIQPQWLKLIVEGKKSLEIRGTTCKNVVGQTVWLSASESRAVTASVKVAACDGPLSEKQFDQLRKFHLYEGRRPYNKTYVWKLEDVKSVPPISIKRKPGSIIWQIGPG